MATTEAPARPGDTENAQGQLMAQKQWRPSSQDVDNIARICHEANRAVCVCNKDLSQPAWDDAPDWQKESARTGVLFHISNPYVDSKRSHDEWMETKLRDGWRFGLVKDATKKEHPSLLPYHALPDTEKVKDDIFKAIVSGYLEALKRSNFSDNSCGSLLLAGRDPVESRSGDAS